MTRIDPRSVLGWTLLGLAVSLGTTGCSPAPDEQRTVLCDPVTVEGTAYCVYEDQSVANSRYDCPKDRPKNIEINGGTICARSKELPEGHREELLERARGLDPGSGEDASTKDAGFDGSPPPPDTVGPDTRDAVDPDTSVCREPRECPSTSETDAPTYLCHRPQTPTSGEPFTLTIYGEHFAPYENGRAEVATNTGFREVVTVDNRCKLSVDLPAYVWGNDRTSFGIEVSNQRGSFEFPVQGE